jgi:hypothetical protein
LGSHGAAKTQGSLRMTDQPGVLSECDLQTFDRCIREASLLGEQMAQLLKHPGHKFTDDISSPLNPEERVIRLLRIVPKQNR